MVKQRIQVHVLHLRAYLRFGKAASLLGRAPHAQSDRHCCPPWRATILDGATAKLPPRGRIGLIGRNGAGKTTLVKVIAHQLEADAGSVDMPRGARSVISRRKHRAATRRRSKRCSPPIWSAPNCSTKARPAMTRTGSAKSTSG
jgi:hypothetical protein